MGVFRVQEEYKGTHKGKGVKEIAASKGMIVVSKKGYYKVLQGGIRVTLDCYKIAIKIKVTTRVRLEFWGVGLRVLRGLQAGPPTGVLGFSGFLGF